MFNNTIVGQPYKRINSIKIDYPAPLTQSVSFAEQEFVPLADGSRRPIGSENIIDFTVSQSQLDAVVPLTDINTGEPLGIEMSYGQIMLGILAAIRAHQ